MKKTGRIIAMAITGMLLFSNPFITLASAQKEMTIQATVPGSSAEYYVEVPESISLGSLNTEAESVTNYSIAVTGTKLDGGTLSITAPKTGTMYLMSKSKSTESLSFTNDFDDQEVQNDSILNGNIAIAKEELSKAQSGDYSGTLNFSITYYDADSTTSEADNGTSSETDSEASSGEDAADADDATNSAAIHLMKSSDITSESMCDPLFYPTAELTLNSDSTVNVTLYCVSPVPGFSSSGAPVETMLISGKSDDVSITGSGKTDYSIETGSDSFTSKATITSNVATKYYDASGTFIPTAGNYASDSFTFTIPVSAIRNSAGGAVYVNAFVGTVMNTWQSFYLIFDVDTDFGKTSTIQNGSYAVETEGCAGASVSGLKAYATEKNDAEYVFKIDKATASEDSFGVAACAELISAAGVSGTSQYYALSLHRTDADGTTTVSDTGTSVLDISIPLKGDSTQTVSVYRHHSEELQTSMLTAYSTKPSSNYIDGTYYWDRDNGILHIYSSKFSVYAVHLSDSANGSSSSGSSESTTATDTSTTTVTNYTASISMRKSSDFTSVSMCNSLFYQSADIVVNGTTSTLTLYVIDPIPNFAEEGTPLSDVNFTTSSGTYSASVDATNKVGKYYDADGIFISTDGNYESDVITVTLPTSALKSSANGTVLCSAYVNSVMKSTQSFYVVLSDWVEGSSSSSSDTVSVSTSSSSSTSTKSSSSSKLDIGTYQVPVSALKEKTDDTSMMEDYMYPYANLVVAKDSTKLTIYIQHTVAGIDGGGPKYLSYKSAEAEKVENAVTISGEAYDSFTMEVSNPVVSILNVTMYINAMSMEVSARMVLDLDKIKAASAITSDGQAAAKSAMATSKAVSTGSSLTDSAAGKALSNIASELALRAKSVAVKIIFEIILAGVLGVAGYAGYIKYRRKRQ